MEEPYIYTFDPMRQVVFTSQAGERFDFIPELFGVRCKDDVRLFINTFLLPLIKFQDEGNYGAIVPAVQLASIAQNSPAIREDLKQSILDTCQSWGDWEVLVEFNVALIY